MLFRTELSEALLTLGDLLEEEGLNYDLVVVGGGALLLSGLIQRSTEDVDVVAQVVEGRWRKGRPFPPGLRRAIRRVALAHDLPTEDRSDKDWLNAGPSFLFTLGLPTGFQERVELWEHGGLRLRIASRVDQIHLKLWAATSMQRGRRDVDLSDLRELAPTDEEWRAAALYCMQLDGRADFFVTDIQPMLAQLGVVLESLDAG